jgi:cysteinyl-tRNA synthetase
MLQAHYRSTLDFSNEALKAAEKGMSKLLSAYHLLGQIEASEKSTVEVRQFENLCAEAINDDFNTPIVLAYLFDLARIINTVNDNKEKLSKEDIDFIQNLFKDYLFDILGIGEEKQDGDSQLVDYLMQTILSIRQEAKQNKDYATSDKIRNELDKLNIQIKDTKEGARWEFKS